jgi:NAD(P)-dependent dehydrogenase (short-subunit alcohol dehydrogenase family)
MTQKHSLIVGGTRGLGRALAALWAAEGQVVTVVGRRPAEMDDVAGPGRIESFPGDAERPEDLLDGLRGQVARLGMLSSVAFLQRYRGRGDPWTGELAVSLTATKVLLEGLAEHLDPQGDKSVVLVTSTAASRVAPEQAAGYHAAKAALRQLARYYAVRLGARGIRVNVVSPCAYVKAESSAFYEGRRDLRDLYARLTPLGRMGTAAEVAQAAAFLCGPQASFITGQELCVDGGLSLLTPDALARGAAGLTV